MRFLRVLVGSKRESGWGAKWEKTLSAGVAGKMVYILPGCTHVKGVVQRVCRAMEAARRDRRRRAGRYGKGTEVVTIGNEGTGEVADPQTGC